MSVKEKVNPSLVIDKASSSMEDTFILQANCAYLRYMIMIMLVLVKVHYT